MKRWICSWGISHHAAWELDCGEDWKVMLYSIRNNIAGSALRFQFSNLYGSHVTDITGARIRKNQEETWIELTVEGACGFEIHAGETRLTDCCELEMVPGDIITVRVEFGGTEKPESGCMTATGAVLCLEAMEVYTEDEPVVVAVFGDSIARQNTWTEPLTEALYQAFPGKAAFLNKSISGNRLIRDCKPSRRHIFGYSGNQRVYHDILTVPGLTHVIFALGTNDLGHPGGEDCPIEELPTVFEYQQEVKALVKQIRKMGIRVIGTTIMGRSITPPDWTQEKDELRNQINDWIRSQEHNLFDEVLDFEYFTARADGRLGLEPEYDCGDGLHLSPAGGLAVKKNIPLSIFKTNTELPHP